MKTSKFDPRKKSEKPQIRGWSRNGPYSSKNKKKTEHEKSIPSPLTKIIIESFWSIRYMGYTDFKLEEDARTMMHYGHYSYYDPIPMISKSENVYAVCNISSYGTKGEAGTKFIKKENYNPKGTQYREISSNNNNTIKLLLISNTTTTINLFEIHLSLFNQIYNLPIFRYFDNNLVEKNIKRISSTSSSNNIDDKK